MSKEELTQQQRDEKLDRNLKIIGGVTTVLVGIATTVIKILESEQALRRRRTRKKLRSSKVKLLKAPPMPPKRKVGRVKLITTEYLLNLKRKADKLRERVTKIEEKLQEEKKNGTKK